MNVTILSEIFKTNLWKDINYWLLYIPPGLIFTNHTFCPHSVFMCSVWIS